MLVCADTPAAKFTRRGFIKVSARTFDGGSRVAVMVQDSGIGIPKNKLTTIFLPFEQVGAQKCTARRLFSAC